MFVTYETTLGGILLREVETEFEAFAEMRRFIEINHIGSDVTEVRWVEEKENLHHLIIPKHKKVAMGTKAVFLKGAGFGIYYDEEPTYLELGDEAKWGIDRGLFSLSYHFNDTINESVCWYDEVKAYLEDLDKRKAGGE